MLEEKTTQAAPDTGNVSFKLGLLLYVVVEALALGVLVYHLLQR
jgi:hypothetical protein